MFLKAQKRLPQKRATFFDFSSFCDDMAQHVATNYPLSIAN